MSHTHIVKMERVRGGWMANCPCGAQLFRYNRAALTKAKTEHLKLDHPTRWKKGRIR